MKAESLKYIKCPNSHEHDFNIYPLLIKRDENFLRDIEPKELSSSDEIIFGFIEGKDNGFIYPIVEHIMILFADGDLKFSFFKDSYKKLYTYCSSDLISRLEENLSRIKDCAKLTDWNDEEMAYYDSEVDTRESRENMVEDILNNPIHRIFFPRKKYITSFLEERSEGECFLEIGCGNSRTVANIFNPSIFKYKYIGIDVSFKRLLVAKQAVPEGDFIQASAMNLPIKDDSMHAVIYFGSLHHLSSPKTALQQSIKTLKNNGRIGFHEPIKKTKLIPQKFRNSKIFSDYAHSSHDDEIDYLDISEEIKKNNLIPESVKFTNSPLRTLIERILKAVSKKYVSSKLLTRAVFGIDSIFIHTFERFSERLGPHAVLGLYRRKDP